jgi:hypothetical protein
MVCELSGGVELPAGVAWREIRFSATLELLICAFGLIFVPVRVLG